MSQANPSWLMTKFWMAAALGAPVYLFDELLAYIIRRRQHAKAAVQRADID
jgi:hypothetical protein